jgi:hypothetical protein
MKYYETQFDDYLQSTEKYNFHPELEHIYDNLPNNPYNIGNLIIYGLSGTGKYTQALRLIKKYSPSELKYDKKLILNSDKYKYHYKISDVHYEIDMALLGCNAKIIWHELFLQIVDIISISTSKFGIILCKNFHTIHSELLPIFYSYIQQYNNNNLPFQIRFILLTEQVSFLPNNILNSSKIIRVKRPNNNVYKHLQLPKYIDKSCVLNLKEIKSLSKIKDTEKIPKEYFDVICELIIDTINNPKKLSLFEFREILYDTLVYNLDFIEVLWNIIDYSINNDKLNEQSIQSIISDIYIQLKQYNNNYRPIYHLESILLNILNHIQKYDGNSSSETSKNIKPKTKPNKRRSIT